MRWAQGVRNNGILSVVATCDRSQIVRAVGANDEDVRVDREIFTIATANVNAYRSSRLRLEEAFNDGPWLSMLVVVAKTKDVGEPCSVLKRNETLSAHRQNAHALLHKLLKSSWTLSWGNCLIVEEQR